MHVQNSHQVYSRKIFYRSCCTIWFSSQNIALGKSCRDQWQLEDSTPWNCPFSKIKHFFVCMDNILSWLSLAAPKYCTFIIECGASGWGRDKWIFTHKKILHTNNELSILIDVLYTCFQCMCYCCQAQQTILYVADYTRINLKMSGIRNVEKS